MGLWFSMQYAAKLLSTMAGKTLAQLRRITQRIEQLRSRRDKLIDQAIDEGHSERVIGEAAGMSGPAIHYRKTRSHP